VGEGQGTTRRPPAGAAVRRPDVTASIRSSVFDELAAVGYGRLSIESVARRAGVGKTTIYRRWNTKQAMVVALVSEIAWTHVDAPDTGTLPGDVSEFLDRLTAALGSPPVRAIASDLLAEANRDSPLAAELLKKVRDPRRTRAGEIIHRAVRRGELPPGVDVSLALDILAGPLFFRVGVLTESADKTYRAALTTAILAALSALPSESGGTQI
jgi:AcrR family transcriptional regulator